jgi:beta-N-acetylhexosaminidase
LPRIDRTREQLDQNELAVFRKFVDDVDSMMICHGWYPCFEPKKTPATLSRRIITDLLRNELGFEGLVMTDDLDMGAILTGYQLDDTIRLVIAAGNDLAMICHRIPEIENVHRILGKLPRKQIDRALKSMARFKNNLTPPDQFSKAAFRNIDSEIWDLRVAVLGEEPAAMPSVEEGKRSPVERY